MIFEKKIGVSLAVTGCIGALVLVVSGVLTEKQAYKAIDSQTIFYLWRHPGAGKSAGNDRGRQAGCGLCNAAGANSSPFMLLIAVFAIRCDD